MRAVAAGDAGCWRLFACCAQILRERVSQPKLGERIYDGAVGSAGFLCEAFEYLRATNPKRTTTQDKKIIIAGIETMHLIRKNQLSHIKDQASSAANQFYSLAF